MKVSSRGAPVFSGLDVGTTKICCIVGQRDAETGGLRILGMGSHPSSGLERGMVVDIQKTTEAIRRAVDKARAVSNTEVDLAYVGIAGDHIVCQNAFAEIAVANPDRGVSHADRDKVIETARRLATDRDREPIQWIPQEFICDSLSGVKNPLDVRCSRLGVRVHVILASIAAAQNIVHCVNQAGLQTRDIVLQSLASSMSVLTDEIKSLGCVLVDIGGGTTDVSVFADGAICYSGVVPEAGDAVTRAIAEAFKISRFDAENLKKRHGHAVAESVDPEETFDVTAALKRERVTLKRRDLARVIETRFEDILDQVLGMLKEHRLLERVNAGVVLTGGSSLLEGLPALAELVFEKPVTVGVPGDLKGMSGPLASPVYATGVGLVQYGLTHQNDLGRRNANLLGRMRRLLGNFMDFY